MSPADHPLTAGGLARAVCRDFARCWRQLLVYEILFKILAFAVLSPLSAWLLSRLIATSGTPALSNEQIAAFLLSPTGISGILLSGAIALATSFAEQAGLIVIAASTAAGKPPLPAMAALRQTGRRATHLLRLGGLLIGVGLLCLVPGAAIVGVTYLALLCEYNINYYLTEKPPAFYCAAAIAGATLTALVLVWGMLYVRWLFALPDCMLERRKGIAALRSSYQLTRDVFWRTAGMLCLWLLAVTLLGAVAAGALHVAEAVLLKLAADNVHILVPTIGGLLTANLLVAALLSFVGIATNCLLVTRLYFGVRCRKGLPAVAPAALAEAAGRSAPSRLTAKRVVFSGALLLLLGTSVASYAIVQAIALPSEVAVTAHRGSSYAAPENSLSAIKAAIADGADFAEIDVQETADGVVVVLHDDDLMRVAGLNRKIWEITYHELRTLDAGSWFSPEFQGERVPTLVEAIEAARGGIRLNIELKFNGHDEKLVERVVQIIQQEDFTSDCVLSSLEYEGVVKAKRLDERLRVGHIVAVFLGDPSELDVDFLAVNADSVTRALIGSAHRRGKEVHAWTVNDRPTMSKLIDMGVDNILTDKPEVLVALLAERSELSTAERILLGFRNRMAE